ncbi:hypothetical protein [Parabacteroides faecis]|uniref:hypothetical protein n=1 Tax=Parabacteroides faecis TaxID=1217282 RepID=UPI003521F95A
MHQITETNLCVSQDAIFNTEHKIKNETLYNGYIFKNCTFKDNLSFENLDIHDGIYFEKCIFEKSIIFKDCKSRSSPNKELQGDQLQTITFIKCIIHDTILLTGNKTSPSIIQRGINITDTEINKIIINHIYCILNGIAIAHSKIRTKFDIYQSRINNVGLSIENSDINGFLRIENIFSNHLSFIKSSFKDTIQLWGGKINESITFNYGEFLNDFEIYAVKHKGLYIHDADFRKHLRLRTTDSTNNISGGPEVIYIMNSTFSEGFIITSNDIEKKHSLSQITINATKSLSGDLIFNGLTIKKEILLQGSNYDSNIAFQNISTKNINQDNFSNYSSIIFYRFNSNEDNDSSFVIKKSNLGNTTFLNCDLNSFQNIEIEDSILSQIKYANIKWFTPSKINKHLKSNDLEAIQNKREILRQLKIVSEENKDRPNFLLFKAWELKTYSKEKNKFGDKFILNFNWYSNKNGISGGVK